MEKNRLHGGLQVDLLLINGATVTVTCLKYTEHNEFINLYIELMDKDVIIEFEEMLIPIKNIVAVYKNRRNG